MTLVVEVANRYGDPPKTYEVPHVNLINPETHGDPMALMDRIEYWKGEEILFVNAEAVLTLKIQEKG